jgi:hypothetical protein
MEGPGAGFPHIPDEWSREPSKPVKTTNISSSGNVTTVTTKKRKRAASTYVENPTDATSQTLKSTSPPCNLSAWKDIPTKPQLSVGMSTSTSHRNCDETESVLRGLYNQVEKLARRPGCALQDGIYLDSIMTHIPYSDVLQQMFGGNTVQDSACVPIVTRAYEESYMREVFGATEEACIMGSSCECQFVDEHNPFTGVRFTLPVEAFSSSVDNIDEFAANKLCVLCCRKNTQSLFYEALYNHRAYSACIQLYGNVCDRPGEYAKEAMLICPLNGPINNMPLPLVAHQRNRYSVVVHNGVRQLRQHRVAYEDFHQPSSSRS